MEHCFYPKCSGPEVIEVFSCAPPLSMKFFLIINFKMPTMFITNTDLSRKFKLPCCCIYEDFEFVEKVL